MNFFCSVVALYQGVLLRVLRLSLISHLRIPNVKDTKWDVRSEDLVITIPNEAAGKMLSWKRSNGSSRRVLPIILSHAVSSSFCRKHLRFVSILFANYVYKMEMKLDDSLMGF